MCVQGDTSAGVSEAQAAVLQRAIRALRDPSLASNLIPLAVMPLPQLQELLSTHAVNIREVRAVCCVCACVFSCCMFSYPQPVH